LSAVLIAMQMVFCRGNNQSNKTSPAETAKIKPNYNVDATTSYTLRKSRLYVDRDAILPNSGFKHGIAYADFNHDGNTDVFISSGNGTKNRTPVAVLINDGSNHFIDGTNSIMINSNPGAIHPRKALAGDFNGDGWPDIFVIGHGFDQAPWPGEFPLLFLSDGKGGLSYSNSCESLVGYHHGAASADIDADGDIDILLLDNPFSSPFFLINDGHGNFTKESGLLPTFLAQKQLYTCELIDIDRDGFVDIIAGGHENANMPTIIYWGSGSGKYESSKQTILPPLTAWGTVLDYAAEDIDGDGLKDLIINRTNGYSGRYIQIIRQTLSRQFTDETSSRITMDCTLTWFDYIRVQDFDGDGKPDIFKDGKEFACGECAWRNIGQGFFLPYFGEINPFMTKAIQETSLLFARSDRNWISAKRLPDFPVSTAKSRWFRYR